MNTSELKNLVDNDLGISIYKQCEMLGVPKSSIYSTKKGKTELNLKLMALIDKQH